MKSIFPRLFFFLLLGILAGSVIYLSRQVTFFLEHDSATIWYFVFSALLVFMITGLLVFSNSTTFFGSILYKSAALTMGFLLYFLMIVSLSDLADIFLKVSPGILGIIAFGLTLITIASGVLNSFSIRTTTHKIDVKNLSDTVRIAHLSDIHIGHFRGEKFLQQIVDKTNREQPDIIVITGDLFDGKIRIKESVLQPLKKLKAPILFVNGNHDGYSGLRTINSLLPKVGVQVLQNEIVKMNGLQIIGLNHMRPDNGQGGMHAPDGPNMKDVLNSLNIDQSKPTILLHHSPDGVVYANQHGVDLYLSGHTHGGQQFPVTLINELLFKYNRGLNSFKNTRILVSEGIGTFGPPLRIGTKSEIVIIELFGA